jgi:hypothetical protein
MEFFFLVFFSKEPELFCVFSEADEIRRKKHCCGYRNCYVRLSEAIATYRSKTSIAKLECDE